MYSSTTGWFISSNVQTTECGARRAYVPEVQRMYIEHAADDNVIETFDFMDRLIQLATREHFIETLKRGWNGTHLQRAYLTDLSTPGIDTNCLTWLVAHKADASGNILLDRTSVASIPVRITLYDILQRSGLDLLIAMHIVYGMNHV